MICVSVFCKACGFRLNVRRIQAAVPLIPKTELPRKIIRAHSTRLLEIAPKPCYQSFIRKII